MGRLMVMLFALAACGTAGAPRYAETAGDFNTQASAMLATAVADPVALAKLMRGSVQSSGVWFTDPACTRQFPSRGVIDPGRFAVFARCIASMQLTVSKRYDQLPDFIVLHSAAGFELEVQIIDEDAGPRLAWIGYGFNRGDAIPAISSEALAALRVEHDVDGAIDPAALELARSQGTASVWLRLCLDAEGAISSVKPRFASTLAAGRAYVAMASARKYRPFLAAGTAMPVCANLAFSTKPGDEYLPVDSASHDTLVSWKSLTDKPPTAQPSLAVKRELRRIGLGWLVAGYRVCIAASGTVESIEQVRRSGSASYDLQLAQAIAAHPYTPYSDRGTPVRVCIALVYIFKVR